MEIRTRLELWHSISKLRGQTGEERQTILDEHRAKWVKVEEIDNMLSGIEWNFANNTITDDLVNTQWQLITELRKSLKSNKR